MKIAIYDALTEKNEIRDMSAEEIEAHNKNITKLEETLQAAENKRLAALSKLHSLGLDEEDIKALGLGGN